MLEAAKAEGMEVPSLDDRPHLEKIHRDLLEMYWFLNRHRNISGMGDIGYIPLTAIISYCAIYDIQDVAYISDFVSIVDSNYMEMVLEGKNNG